MSFVQAFPFMVYGQGMSTVDFLVLKDKLQDTETRGTPQLPLADGPVRVRIDKFALTSNNITCAAFGDAMNYWGFFPLAHGVGHRLSLC